MQKIYCRFCENKIDSDEKLCPFCAKPIELEKSRKVQGQTDLLSSSLGLQKLDLFSWTHLFRDVFASRKPEELEKQLSYGFPDSTPKLDAIMLVPPAPWLFARMLLWSLSLFIAFLIAYDQYKNINIIPGLILVGTFSMPITILVLFYELNTIKNISFIKIIQIFVTSGVVSIIVTLILNQYFPITKNNYFMFIGPIEEISKLFTIIFLMKSLNFNRYRFSVNGLLFGAAVGAGFAAFESAGFALKSGLINGNTGMIGNIIFRGFLAPFNHAVWSAISVCAFWRARQFNSTNTETLFDMRFLIIFIIPCLLHFCWNYEYEMPYFSKYLIIGIIGWAIVFRLYQDGLKQIESTLITLNNMNQPNIRSTNESRNTSGWLLSGIMPNGQMIKFNLSIKDSKYIIGRDETADLIISDPSVSRQHCSLSINKGKLWINDIESTNGTYVNGEAILTYGCELKISDHIKLGSIQLSVSSK